MSTTEHKKMLDATYGLKNIMGRHFLAIEQAYRDGKATAWATSGCPVEILYAMDVQPILPENSATISAAQKYSQNFIELAEAEGYSYDLCSYFKTNVGAVIDNADMTKGGTRKPTFMLSTDVICGFPGESTEAFERTKNLIREIQPDIVNVSKFFSRPHTAAEKLNPLPPKEVNRRSKETAKLSKQIALEKNRAWINWDGPTLFDERGKGESWMGRNFAYKPIVVKACESLLGKFVQVRVVNAFSTYLEAEVVDGS